MARAADRLADYNARRDFRKTAEPRGKAAPARRTKLGYLIQKHDARRLHFDLRLEWDGVLLSWAVTRGPSGDPGQKRLSVRTEDHPLAYGSFEGTIAKGEYGAGTVMLWDRGTWEPLHDPDQGLAQGKLHFRLHGERLKGGWALVRMGRRKGETRENWLLIKERDDTAEDDAERLVTEFGTSVATGRTMDEIANGARPRKGAAKAARPKAKRKRKTPAFTRPQLATLVDAAPAGEQWLHEAKIDGYRCLVAVGAGGARCYTRSGLDWTDRFTGVAQAAEGLACDSALLDGEAVAPFTGEGSRFSALQQALKEGGRVDYVAFDLLELDGKSLVRKPLVERKAALEMLLAKSSVDGVISYSIHVAGSGQAVFEAMCGAGGEGIVSKRADAPYSGRRTKAWLKVKCGNRQEFVIGGLSPSSRRGRPFASVLVGSFDDGRLRYRGRVGSGFTQDMLEDVAERVESLRVGRSPFESVPADIARQAIWLRPTLVAEIEFAEMTADGHVRHGVFVGLRQDKAAKAVTLEKADSMAGSSGPVVAGVTITSPDREVFTAPAVTKADLARYYATAAGRVIGLAGGRPVSLLRCPDGAAAKCFFQKHAGAGFPDGLRQIGIEESSGETQPYMCFTTPAGLIGAVQMGTIEFHIWGSRTDKLERPDRIVFDLDPDEGLGFSHVRDAAADVRGILGKIGLASAPMVTGGKGVHVIVPLKRTVSWETVATFAKTVAHVLAEREPDRYVATMSKAKRKGKIFIDWLRNERGSTAIAPYSVRAREGAPVAVPVTWVELAKLDRANGFSLSDAAARLKRACPLEKASKNPQHLGRSVLEDIESLIQEGQDSR